MVGTRVSWSVTVFHHRGARQDLHVNPVKPQILTDESVALLLLRVYRLRFRLFRRASAPTAASPVPSKTIAVGSGFCVTVAGAGGRTMPSLGPALKDATLKPRCFPLLF